LLTEATVEKSFRKILEVSPLDDAICDKAEAMLDELRPESPLRHRLAQELEEIREIGEARK
jgi:hypothetical protein